MDLSKLNEDLLNIINESNRYATEQDVNNGDITEDDYLDSFEYIYSQKLCGNLADYREKLSELQASDELKDYALWCEEYGCTPEIEKYIDNKDAEPSEAEDYDYIYSSLLNGNLTQYKKQLKRLQSKGQLKNYKVFCDELGVNPEIEKWL